MSILKMIPGQKIAFTVERVEQVEGKFGPQYAFRGETPDDTDAVMYLNVDAAERQLSRIGLTHSSVVGQTVEFERTEKNGTKYTNINRTNGAPPVVDFKKLNQQKQAYSSGPALPYEQETGAPPHGESGSVHQKVDKMFSVYDVCLDHAHAVAKRQFGNDVTDTAVAAMTATLFIAAKEGLR